MARRDEPHASERATWDPPETEGRRTDDLAFGDGEATIAYGAGPSSIPAPVGFDDDEATTFDSGRVPDRPTEPVPSARSKNDAKPGAASPPAGAHVRTGGSLGHARAQPERPPTVPPATGGAPTRNGSQIDLAGGPTQSFGRFTLGPAVGSGGMAEVRLGYEHRPDGSTRPTVIKRIARNYLAQAKYQEMFREEIRLSRLLRHPNIVEAYDDGIEDGVPYIVFELIDGVTVADLKKLGGKIPVSVALEVAEGVLMGLEYAHQVANDRGQALALVHRDISPQNVLVSRRGEVKIVDFGIARFEGREHMTMAGEVKGKMRYMAPEQLAEKGLDGRTDLFALGIVLGELLGVLEDGLTEHFCSGIKKVVPSLPTRVHDLLLSLTQPKPENRPRSASEALAEVRLLRERLEEGPSLLEFAAREVFPKRESLMKAEAPKRAAPKVEIAWGTDLGDELPDDDDGDAGDEGESQMGYADTVLRHRHLLPEVNVVPQVTTSPSPRAETARARPVTPTRPAPETPARAPVERVPTPRAPVPRAPTPHMPMPRPLEPQAQPPTAFVTPRPMDPSAPFPPAEPSGAGPHPQAYAPTGMHPMGPGMPGAYPGAYPGTYAGPYPGMTGVHPMGEHPMADPMMPPQPVSGVYTHPGYVYPPALPPPPRGSGIWPLALAVGALALVLLGLVLVVLTR